MMQLLPNQNCLWLQCNFHRPFIQQVTPSRSRHNKFPCWHPLSIQKGIHSIHVRPGSYVPSIQSERRRSWLLKILLVGEWRHYEIACAVSHDCSHLFGAASSPGCSNFGLKKTATDNECEFDSDAAALIRKDFYVDSCYRFRSYIINREHQEHLRKRGNAAS